MGQCKLHLHRLLTSVLGGVAVLIASVNLVTAADRLAVVASFSILGDLAAQVGGDRVEVHTLIGAGNDAHAYQPTPVDARRLARAQMVVVNGLGFEGWLDRLIHSAGYRGPVVVASKGVRALQREEMGDHDGDRHRHDPSANLDPHAWQDLGNGRLYVENIAAALSTIDPAGKAQYQNNAARLQARLLELEQEIRTTFSTLPADRRKVVTSHDAFAYFGRAYGIRFFAPVKANKGGEPAASDVAAIIRQLRQDQVKTVFLETITDPRLLQRISRESGARIGGTLYSDSLAKPGLPADTYLGMMRENYRTLRAALTD